MAVPKKKTSKSRRGMRRSHDALSAPENYSECQECGRLKKLHNICGQCGFYRGRRIVESE